MKVLSFFSIFLFLFCMFIPFVEGAYIGLFGVPDLRWKEWTVGQSSGSVSVPLTIPRTPLTPLSFITNSETTK